MLIADDTYADHQVFTQLEKYVQFYESLAFSVFGFCSKGTRAVCNIDSYVYSSMQGTLESMKNTLKTGRIGDAYALLRKFYDSAIINVYSNLFLDDHFSIDNFIVEKIDNWLQGKERLPEYRVMSRYIRSSARLKPVNDLLYLDARYKRIRDRCNDHTHYNFFQHVLLNDSAIYLETRPKWVDAFSKDVRDIVILHLSYVFFLNDHYMMSSDYVDYLECNMTPEPDSQYWVAPFIQQMFTDVLVKERPDIAASIKGHTCMHLS